MTPWFAWENPGDWNPCQTVEVTNTALWSDWSCPDTSKVPAHASGRRPPRTARLRPTTVEKTRLLRFIMIRVPGQAALRLDAGDFHSSDHQAHVVIGRIHVEFA